MLGVQVAAGGRKDRRRGGRDDVCLCVESVEAGWRESVEAEQEHDVVRKEESSPSSKSEGSYEAVACPLLLTRQRARRSRRNQWRHISVICKTTKVSRCFVRARLSFS